MGKKLFWTEKEELFMSSKLDLFLESFNKSVLEVTQGTYGGKWPMPYFTSIDVGMLIDNYWSDAVITYIDELEKNAIPLKDFSEKIKFPSRFSRPFYDNITLKFKGYPTEKIKKVNEFLAEFMFHFYKKDHFCMNITNILWDEEKIKEKFNKEKLIRTESLKDKKILAYNGYFRAITEMLYLYFDNLGHEIHGPYELESGERLVIREWYDLKPEYYDFVEGLPFSSVRVYEVYKPETGIRIDISNRVFIDESLDKCITGFYFEIDDESLGYSKTVKTMEIVKSVCAEGCEELERLSLNQLLERAVKMHFYIFKPITDIIGFSWEPSKECMERVKKGITEAEKVAFQKLMKTQINDITVKQLFDYRLKLPDIFYE